MIKKSFISIFTAAAIILTSIGAFAANVNVDYEGNGNLEITDPTYFDSEKTQPTFYANGDIAGNYGKANSDLVYELTGYSQTAGAGKDYIAYWTGTVGTAYVMESQMCITDNTTTIDWCVGLFTSADKSEFINGNIFRVYADGSVGLETAANYVADTYKGKILTTIEKYKWYNFAVKIPTGGKMVYLYINGEEYPIEMSKEFFGVRHTRIATGKAPDEANRVPFCAYIDNLSMKATDLYTNTDYMKTAVTSNIYRIEGNVINIDGIEKSAEEILENISAEGGNIRIFRDSDMTMQISGEQTVNADSVLVCATVKDGKEVCYNYYTFSLPEDESGLYNGNNELTLVRGGSVQSPAPDGYTDAFVYPSVGSYGKKVADSTYFWGGKTHGSNGYYYLSMGGATTASQPARIIEYSFMMDEGATGMDLCVGAFYTEEDGTQSSNFANAVQYGFSFNEGVKLNSAVSANLTGYSIDETTSVLGADTRNRTLSEIEPGKWYSIAMVFYCDKTSKFDMYVNGVKYELNWNFVPSLIRHVRLSARGNTDQKIYLDNVKFYNASVSDAKNYVCRDALANTQFTYEVRNNVIKDIIYGTTAGQLKESIVTDGNIRIYSDAKCETAIPDDCDLTADATIVIAAENNTVHERSFDYYTIEFANDYDDLTLQTRVSNLCIKDYEGNDVTDGQSVKDEYYINFNAKNLSDQSRVLTVVIALYDDEMTLVDMVKKTVTINGGEIININNQNGIKISNDMQTGNVCAYVWAADTMMPFADSCSVAF